MLQDSPTQEAEMPGEHLHDRIRPVAGPALHGSAGRPTVDDLEMIERTRGARDLLASK